MLTIAILASGADVHARNVLRLIQTRHRRPVVILPNDLVAGTGALHWAPDDVGSRLPTAGGGAIQIAELGAIWYRRGPARQRGVGADHAELAASECGDGVLGSLTSSFVGHWASDPWATERSGNKLVQLAAARAAGLRVPRTIVSQDPAAIRALWHELGGAMIVKPVRGDGTAHPVERVAASTLERDEDLAFLPAVYQEAIDGRRHLRIHVFGERVMAAEIVADELDWRFDLNRPFAPAALDDALATALRDVLARLGLVMGVIDVKLTAQGEPVFLEVNPQGQFLFVEGLAGLELSAAMADYLVSLVEREDLRCAA